MLKLICEARMNEKARKKIAESQGTLELTGLLVSPISSEQNWEAFK